MHGNLNDNAGYSAMWLAERTPLVGAANLLVSSSRVSVESGGDTTCFLWSCFANTQVIGSS